MNQLQRVQIYLDPDSIALINEIVQRDNISRSQVIRNSLTKTLNPKNKKTKTKNKKRDPLMEMSGIEVSKTGKVAQNIDEMYLHD